MATEVVEVLIEGGKATAAPPLGPALGPLGVNIGLIVADINKKTQDFKGMQVPVKVSVDTESKQHKITVGTPPASQLLIKEANIPKGSGTPNTAFAADLKMEQIIKVAKMKEDALLGKDPIMRVKEVLGTCQSMGLKVEGKIVQEILKDVDSGMYDKKIMSGKTELSVEELKELEEEKKRMQEELKERRAEFLEKANEILNSMKEAERKEIEQAMIDAEIPLQIISEVLPEEEAAEGEAKPKPAGEAASAPGQEKPAE